MLYALLASALILPSGAAHARLEDREALSAYVQARAAGSSGATDEAARAFAAALASAPGNELIAAQAFDQALDAGNRALALNAARAMERSGPVGREARLVLLADALRSGNGKRASAQIDALADDQLLAFMAPLLRAWVAAGTRKGDPLKHLQAGAANPLTAAYGQEHRPLLLLASGKREAGAAELKAVTGALGIRDQRLRIGAAALLAKRDRKAALDLLAGEAQALLAARRLIEEGKEVPGPIGTASAGIAELLVRIAGDLHSQQFSEPALRFARLATFFAPENSETWLVTADLLAQAKRYDAGLVALDQVDAGDPFAENVADARIRLLVAAGRAEKALAGVEAAARDGGDQADWSRLGDLLGELDRHEEAAAAYAEALTKPGNGQPEWALHLLRGGALEQAGKWPEAKAALEAAYKLAPEQAIVLNYLGYAQLERRENIPEAMRLITEASRLQPDSPEITDSLGWAHFLLGDTAKAIELLERAAQGGPADPEINEHLGDAYYRAGRRYEARYAWKAALLFADSKDAERLRAKIEAGLTPALASP